jgi:hypothetical protein
MTYKGVDFTVTAAALGIWKWQFRIGDRVIAGKTEANLSWPSGGSSLGSIES